MNVELKSAGLWELLLWLARRRRRFRVTGHSMQPLLKPGDEVLINPRAYAGASPRPGDLVVARHPLRPNIKIIKRVTAVATNGGVILHGDNPPESTDSRVFGPVPPRLITGKVTRRFGC